MSVENQELEDGEIGDQEEQEEQVDEDLLQEARTMGWTPKDKFKGDPDKWVDAEEFVEKGRHVMPILLENNKRMRKELLTRDQKIDNLQKAVESSQAALKALEKHYTAANKRAVETAKVQLREQIRQAREEGDVDTELTLTDQLDDLKHAKPDPIIPEETPDDESNKPKLDPSFLAWKEENPWFEQDKKRTKTILRIAEDLRDEGTDLTGREFFDECTRILEKQEARRPNSGKVEGGQQRGGGGGGKSFSSLPQEAKEACWEDVEVLVGPGKTYKTKADWEKAYAAIYYAENQ